jgi:hypothetical protein
MKEDTLNKRRSRPDQCRDAVFIRSPSFLNLRAEGRIMTYKSNRNSAKTTSKKERIHYGRGGT